MPLATTGAFVKHAVPALHGPTALQSGVQVVGVPVQPVCPAASNTKTSGPDATYTFPVAPAGGLGNVLPVMPVHKGVQVAGMPEQPCWPAASKACTRPSVARTYALPPTTAGDEISPLVVPVHARPSVA